MRVCERERVRVRERACVIIGLSKLSISPLSYIGRLSFLSGIQSI